MLIRFVVVIFALTLVSDYAYAVVQKISGSPAIYEIVDGEEMVRFNLIYDTEPTLTQTTGIAIRLHYDSSVLTFVEVKANERVSDLIDIQVVKESESSDDLVAATDKVVLAVYLSNSGQFPLLQFTEGNSFVSLNFPLNLYSLTFALVTEGFDGKTELHINTDTASSNTAEAEPITLDFSNPDQDGIAYGSDNCPDVANASQVNSDLDGLGDACDEDDDNDGLLDLDDPEPTTPNTTDTDDDGLLDVLDQDDDNDGVLDSEDGFPLVSLGGLTDTDGDGYPNECDSRCILSGMEADKDDDNDGYEDADDAFPVDPNEARDLDGNGEGDRLDSFNILRSELELNVLDQRMVSYLGRFAVNLMSDLEDNLEFGYSEDWAAARGSTVEGSLKCEDGGGYDISVTRSDFSSLQGTVTAENCVFQGLTVTGTVSFEYEDVYWDQSSPMQNYPLTMTFANAQIRDGLNRSFTYSGAASCDWRFNNSSSNYTLYEHGPFGPYDFGKEYDGQLIAVKESGSRFDGGSAGWQDYGLEVNRNGTTDIYQLYNPNCDIKDTVITHRGSRYEVAALKFIGEYGGSGFALSSKTREQRKITGKGIKLEYAINFETLEVLYDPPSTGTTPERFNHPEVGEYSFLTTGGNPTTNIYAQRGEFLSNFYQETYQYNYQYLIYLSGNSDEFSANNSYTPWGEPNSWRLGVDLDGDGRNDVVEGWRTYSYLWTDGSCGWVVERYQGLQLYKQYTANDIGICQISNGFHVDSFGKTVFQDLNFDGNNEIFDDDDDDDGYLDYIDAFPLNDAEWLDTDGDGVGNNTDLFDKDPTEQFDNDDDGIGDNADADDDNDTLSDAYEASIGTSPNAADTDGDGVTDNLDDLPLDENETIDTDADGIGNNVDNDDDDDGVIDDLDAFPLNSSESADSDNDGVGDNADLFPQDSTETVDADADGIGDNADVFDDDPLEAFDTDNDGLGNNADLDDDNDGFTDEEELADGTNPLSRFSCRSGCFSFDVDENLEAQPLTDGLLVIRHLFGFSGDSLTSGAVSGEASRDSSDSIASYLTDADSQLDIDGDGESKPLTDGLLLIRYLFGFSGDSLISGAIGSGATRDTAEAVEAYIKERVPAE